MRRRRRWPLRPFAEQQCESECQLDRGEQSVRQRRMCHDQARVPFDRPSHEEGLAARGRCDDRFGEARREHERLQLKSSVEQPEHSERHPQRVASVRRARCGSPERGCCRPKVRAGMAMATLVDVIAAPGPLSVGRELARSRGSRRRGVLPDPRLIVWRPQAADPKNGIPSPGGPKVNIPPSDAASQYPSYELSLRPAMTRPLRWRLPVDPKYGAS